MAMAKTGMSWHKRIASTLTRTWIKPHSAHYEPEGGLALARNKPGLETPGVVIRELPLPEQLIFPLLDYAKQPVKVLVSVGASVKLGDRLAHGIIATADGVVSAIEPRQIIHPSYRKSLSVVIDVNTPAGENTQSLSTLDALDTDRLERACISGLGGAGFSTASKLDKANSRVGGIHTLLINAVECEPLISCDEALIRSDAHSVVHAIGSMIKLSACQRCIIAIEDDKTDAIAELDHAISAIQAATNVPIEFVQLSAVYPSGAEKVLVQRITGIALKDGTRASDHGVLCINVATVVAAWRAQNGYPLISRIVTIGGNQATTPCNIRVRIGTSVADVLRMSGNTPGETTIRVRAGGPLSGFDLPSLSVPITATTNCITLETVAPKIDAAACIRCSQCSEVCPVNLVPQQMLWHASGDDLAGATRFGLGDCIECGCCDIVCPSFIELTSTFRHARASLREQQHQQHEAELARERYEQRQIRLKIREQEAQRIRDEKKSQLKTGDDAIADALARARARKRQR